MPKKRMAVDQGESMANVTESYYCPFEAPVRVFFAMKVFEYGKKVLP